MAVKTPDSPSGPTLGVLADSFRPSPRRGYDPRSVPAGETSPDFRRSRVFGRNNASEVLVLSLTSLV